MPYKNADDENLPSYIKKLSKTVRAKWISIFNQVYEQDGESIAFRVANKWLKKHISSKKDLVGKAGNSPVDEYFSLTFNFPENEIVFKAEGDEEYIEAVLTDIDYDSDGRKLDESFLYELAEQINKNGLVGDFDHEQLEELKKRYLGNPEAITREMKRKKGIAKAVKAVVNKGKLWIKALIDKRYKKRILASKGLSLEGFFRRKEGGDTYDGGTIFGFTFGEKMNPRNPRALIDVTN